MTKTSNPWNNWGRGFLINFTDSPGPLMHFLELQDAQNKAIEITRRTHRILDIRSGASDDLIWIVRDGKLYHPEQSGWG
jgi:hypothetical protein